MKTVVLMEEKRTLEQEVSGPDFPLWNVFIMSSAFSPAG